MTRRLLVPLALLVLLAAACGGTDEPEGASGPYGSPAPSEEPSAPPSPEEPQEPAVALMELPAEDVAKCRKLPPLRPLCSLSVVEADSGYHRASANHDRYAGDVFFAEWSAPRPGITAKNAPPDFAHVAVYVGDYEKFVGYAWPGERLKGEVPDGQRRKALLIDSVTWNGRKGEVVLAPSYPFGGMDGDHVVFRWAEGKTDYAVSLHAWDPVDETVAALQAMVESLP